MAWVACLVLAGGVAAAAAQTPAPAPPRVPRPAGLDEETPPPHPIPMTPEALCLRGDHYLDDASRASLVQARRMFEMTIDLYPDSACGHAGLSRSLAASYLRRIEEDDALIERATGEARRALELDPKLAVAHAALAGAMLAGLNLDEANTSIETALSIAPDSVPALQTAATVRLASGDLEAARATIDRAILIRPDLPVSHHTRGNVALLMGERADAIDSYRNALRLSPDFVPSALQVAAAYEEMGNFLAAGQIFRDLIQDHPEESSRAYLYMGHSLMKRNSWNAALGAFAKIDFKTHKGLSNGTVIYLKGLCYEELGRAEEARAAFREVIDHWPDATSGFASPERLMFPAYEGLGRLCLKERDTEKAQAVMEEGIAHSNASLELYLRLARLYQDYRMPERAGALLEKAVSRDLGARNARMLLSAYLMGVRLGRDTGDRARIDRLLGSLDGQASRLEALHDYVHDLDAMRIYSVAGRADRALQILRRGLKAGYVRIEWLANDPDLEGLRATDGFRQLARGAEPAAHPSH